jgi:hypothetical protein
VRQRIARYISVLGSGGVPVLLLTVPWADPAPLRNGSPAPAAAPIRHTRINAMLRSAASANPGRVGLLDLDRVISPGNRYTASINGEPCRFDGVHFTIYCARLLQADVLRAVRTMIP